MKLLAPLAPHFAEEEWEKLGNTSSVHNESWPEYNELEMQIDLIEIPIQINGKIRGTIKVNKDITKEEISKEICKQENIQKAILGKNIKKEIYIPEKIYSLVVV